MRIIRVVSSGAAKATKDLGTRVTLTAKNEGAYGNNIYGTVTSQGATFTLVVEDKNPRAILPIETYTNLTTDNLVSETAGSKLVDVTLRGNNGNQAAVNETKLSGGSDGTVADTDYEAALTQAEAINAGNVLFLDVNNAIRNGYLKNHAAAQQDKMVIVAGGENDTIAQTVNAVGSLRDTDGRIIYAYPWVQTVINGTLEFTNPSAWIASVFSQIPSHVALSRVQNSQFLGGATALKKNLTRTEAVTLNENGILTLEQDAVRGITILNAVTTQIANSQNREILRRRMADFLTDSIARFLDNYRNAVNSVENREEVKAMILEWDARLVRDGILPSARDIQGGGSPVNVDIESLNTDDVIASGMFKIGYKRRIYSSMRYIVLQAEIGTNVVVTEEN